ncbi:Integral membrane protein [Lasiodiplodia theobromae]|uniref:Integral membrane protein n=1 Tax=Lasiodiplodia theobromae TaxID=45133 RepID=UPI0015C3FDFA|nr:Integral membrane protein [Lasiodiplodia theobromae]KAF4541826.1 Integral membrane protein [Lasiodiplodia theobromae]
MSASVNPDDYELNDEQKHIRESMIAMFCVSVVFVALRCFVRIRLQSQFSTDDGLLLVGLAGYLVMTVMIVLSITEGGFGRKTAELAIQTFYTGAKYLVMAQITYTLAMMITKLSIALLQLRIIGQASVAMRRITFASIAVNVIIGMYEFFALLFQCTPPKKYWTPTMTTGRCADRNGVAIGVYVYSAINLVLDWYYALALAPMVWKLQMRTIVKISTIFVLGMGVLFVSPSPPSETKLNFGSASVANIIRFKSLIGYASETDVLYIFIPIGIWTWAEMCLALIAASVATFRPLIRLLPWAQSHNGSDKYAGNNTPSPFTTWKTWRTPRRRRDPMELSDMGITNVTVQEGTIYASNERQGNGGINDAESQKYILKEQEVDVRSERWNRL